MNVKDTVAVIVGLLTIMTLGLGLLGLAVRYVLVPWLKEHVITPVKETNHQVTVNKHVSNPPTLLDKIDRVSRDVADVQTDVRAASTMFEGHIELSADDRRRLWEAVEDLRRHHRKDQP